MRTVMAIPLGVERLLFEGVPGAAGGGRGFGGEAVAFDAACGVRHEESDVIEAVGVGVGLYGAAEEREDERRIGAVGVQVQGGLVGGAGLLGCQDIAEGGVQPLIVR